MNQSKHPQTTGALDQLESNVGVIEDLLEIAIEEIGNERGRAISVLVAAKRFVDDIKIASTCLNT